MGETGEIFAAFPGGESFQHPDKMVIARFIIMRALITFAR